MKYHFETVLPPPGASFSTELNTGPVLDCLFHVHPECELTLVESGFGTRFIGSSLEPFSELDLVLIGGMVPHHYLNPAPPTEAAPPPDERLNRVLGFIHRRLDRGMPVTLAETAAVACMTPPAFSSYFRKATRRRFIEYILGLKLNRAAQLLIRTDRSVLDIAQESGFPNLSNFNRRFLADKGVSPRDYRRRHRRSLA